MAVRVAIGERVKMVRVEATDVAADVTKRIAASVGIFEPDASEFGLVDGRTGLWLDGSASLGSNGVVVAPSVVRSAAAAQVDGENSSQILRLRRRGWFEFCLFEVAPPRSRSLDGAVRGELDAVHDELLATLIPQPPAKKTSSRMDIPELYNPTPSDGLVWLEFTNAAAAFLSGAIDPPPIIAVKLVAILIQLRRPFAPDRTFTTAESLALAELIDSDELTPPSLLKRKDLLDPTVVANVIRGKAAAPATSLRREFLTALVAAPGFGTAYFPVRVYEDRALGFTTVTTLRSRTLAISRNGVAVCTSSRRTLVSHPIFRVTACSLDGAKFSISVSSPSAGTTELAGRSDDAPALIAALTFYLDAFDYVLDAPPPSTAALADAPRRRSSHYPSTSATYAAPRSRIGTDHRSSDFVIRVYALFPYVPDVDEADDELTLSPGDALILLESFNDHWGLGRTATGSEGFFPLSYTTLSPDLPPAVHARLCNTGVFVPHAAPARPPAAPNRAPQPRPNTKRSSRILPPTPSPTPSPTPAPTPSPAPAETPSKPSRSTKPSKPPRTTPDALATPITVTRPGRSSSLHSSARPPDLTTAPAPPAPPSSPPSEQASKRSSRSLPALPPDAASSSPPRLSGIRPAPETELPLPGLVASASRISAVPPGIACLSADELESVLELIETRARDDDAADDDSNSGAAAAAAAADLERSTAFLSSLDDSFAFDFDVDIPPPPSSATLDALDAVNIHAALDSFAPASPSSATSASASLASPPPAASDDALAALDALMDQFDDLDDLENLI